jgi:hypothetical protein
MTEEDIKSRLENIKTQGFTKLLNLLECKETNSLEPIYGLNCIRKEFTFTIYILVMWEDMKKKKRRVEEGEKWVKEELGDIIN